MHKLYWQFIFVVTLLVSACAPASTNTPIATTQNATFTRSPTATQTYLPSATPTTSITPLPTIPTFTPTIDARTIVTVTPAPKAECPKEDPSVVAKFATPYS